MELRRFLTLFTIALVIMLAVAMWFFPSNDDFRVDNPFWNGLTDVSASCPAASLESLSHLPSLPGDSTLIVIPYTDFTAAELEELERFVERGGTLVLADDYGFGNKVLDYVGLEARFSEGVLLDQMFYYKNERFPRIFHVASSSVTGNIESLVFNHATCLDNVRSGDALALSSSFSFIDLNDNKEWDDGEPSGPLPVIAGFDLGEGQVILVSDPSLFINSMESMDGNSAFIENIANLTPAGVYIDQSHLPLSSLQQTKGRLATVRDSLASSVGAVVLVIVLLAITLLPIWWRRASGIGGQISEKGGGI